MFDEEPTYLLKILNENSKINKKNCRQNRYTDEIKYTGCFIYIVTGPAKYKWFQINLKLPSENTLQKFMNEHLNRYIDGKAEFCSLDEFLTRHNYPRSIGIFEDGTRITQALEYDIVTNAIIGLPSPLDLRSGFPIMNNFIADTAKNIINSIENFELAKIVQLIAVQPNQIGKKIEFMQNLL